MTDLRVCASTDPASVTVGPDGRKLTRTRTSQQPARAQRIERPRPPTHAQDPRLRDGLPRDPLAGRRRDRLRRRGRPDVRRRLCGGGGGLGEHERLPGARERLAGGRAAQPRQRDAGGGEPASRGWAAAAAVKGEGGVDDPAGRCGGGPLGVPVGADVLQRDAPEGLRAARGGHAHRRRHPQHCQRAHVARDLALGAPLPRVRRRPQAGAVRRRARRADSKGAPVYRRRLQAPVRPA
mmetsp:Transcript_12847/g.41844  ORF Transcript_12847/g.41844 Transcript_12847/m.41844 type:complete len:237 (+) Transcript_12847:120-830(+)